MIRNFSVALKTDKRILRNGMELSLSDEHSRTSGWWSSSVIPPVTAAITPGRLTRTLLSSMSPGCTMST
jgi:hypothetical protein